MKSALSASGAIVLFIFLGIAALVGGQPGIVVGLACLWTPLIAFASIAWYRALFAGGRRLSWVQIEDERRRPAPASNGHGGPSRIVQGERTR